MPWFNIVLLRSVRHTVLFFLIIWRVHLVSHSALYRESRLIPVSSTHRTPHTCLRSHLVTTVFAKCCHMSFVYVASRIDITTVLFEVHVKNSGLNKTLYLKKSDWLHAFIIYHRFQTQNWSWSSFTAPPGIRPGSQTAQKCNWTMRTEMVTNVSCQETDSLTRDVGLCDRLREGEWCTTSSYLRCKGWQRCCHPLDVSPSWCYDER